MVDEFADTKQDMGSEPVIGGSKPEKSVDTGAQVIAAIVVVVGLAGALWVLGGGRDAAGDTKPAVCETTHDAKSSKHTAAQLCTALNRSDLPTLLGTPDELAISASGNVSTSTSANGTKTDFPEADVDLKTYSLELSASDDDFPVSELADFLGDTVQKRSLLGHPAVLYSDHTTALHFNLGGGKVHTGPGGIARTLIVAKDAKDGGGSFEVSIWRQDFATPDDAALFRVAEKVLPTVPGWTAG